MYTYISSKTEYDNKLYQAEYAYDHGDYATASMYFIACLEYAEENNFPSSIISYLRMKVQDSKQNGCID